MHRNKTINIFQSKKIKTQFFSSNFLDLQEALLNLNSAVNKSCQHYKTYLLSKNKIKQDLPKDRECLEIIIGKQNFDQLVLFCSDRTVSVGH